MKKVHTCHVQSLGIIYECGHGVTRDLNKAREWYTKAAAQGHRNAKHHLVERTQ